VLREAGMQASPVAMSCPSLWLHPVCCYKRPLKKKDEWLLLLALAFWGFTLCFFGMGSFWKGKELLKEKC
jgi:hypothetical protein